MDGNYIDVQLRGDKHRLQSFLTLFDLAAKVHKYKRTALWLGYQMFDKREKRLAAHMVMNPEANLDIPLLKGIGTGPQLMLRLGPWHVG